MNCTLLYKGYMSNVQYDKIDEVYHGKIEGITDLISFECESITGIEQAFHEAVDDYLACCEAHGKCPDRSSFSNIDLDSQV